MQLIYGGRELDDTGSLKECGVLDDDATFHLLLHKKERLLLHMRSLYGKEFELPCESTEHIRDVKLRIESTECIPAEKQRLVFSGGSLAAAPHRHLIRSFVVELAAIGRAESP